MNFSDYVLGEALALGPQRAAIIHDEQVTSYAALADRVGRFAGLLIQMGAAKGDRIAVLMANHPDHYTAFLGAARAGVICATINVDYGVHEVAHMMHHTDPICIVADEAGTAKYLSAVAEASLSRKPILRVDGVSANAADEPLDQLLARCQPASSVDVDEDDGVLLAFSSGSSGMPKPILTSHAGEIFAARSFRNMWRLNWNDRVLVSLSLGWAYGIGTLSMPTLAAGATIVLMPKFRPDTVSHAIERYRATVMAGVTTMYRMIVDYAAQQQESPNLTSLRMAMTGGEKRNEAVFEKFEQLAGIPVHDLYAQSEIRPVLGYDPVAIPRPVAGAAGCLFPGVEAELRLDDGRVVAPCEVGELYARSRNSFLGYYRQPELSQTKRTPDGWVKTGDLFRCDQAGIWYLVGRIAADMINRGGVKISAGEIEQHLATHPNIRDVVVVAKPHPTYGEEVAACIVGDLDPTTALEVVKKHCSGALSDHKIPTFVMLVDELSYGANGKINRKAMAALVASAD
jgi:acyl-coenzyme A synthetase/AMP-(fatty) acid ligase